MYNRFNSIVINEKKYTLTNIEPGKMYFLFSNNPIAPTFLYVLLEQTQMINVMAKESIRLHNYDFRLRNIHKELVAIERTFNVRFEIINGHIYDMYERVLFLVLKNIMAQDTIIVGTSGLSVDTISKLTSFFFGFLEQNMNKCIIFCQSSYIGKKYPDFELIDISPLGTESAMNVLKTTGTETGETVPFPKSSKSDNIFKKYTDKIKQEILRKLSNVRVKTNTFCNSYLRRYSLFESKRTKEYDRVKLIETVSSDLISGSEGIIIEFKDKKKAKFLAEILDYKNRTVILAELDQNQVNKIQK